MQKWYSAAEVARILGISRATATGLCHDGLLPAVNIARRGSSRCRWRISEQNLAAFARERGNPIPDNTPAPTADRHIAKPTKGFFADVGGDACRAAIGLPAAQKRKNQKIATPWENGGDDDHRTND